MADAPVSRNLLALRTDDLQVPIARQQFSLGMIGACLALVLHAGTRLRRTADISAMLWKWCGLDVRSASYYSIRLWLLRLGLYQLNRPKVKADDWMWIADHTIQMGERKCLIIVGIRQSAWDALHRERGHRVLSHEDVMLIALEPVTKSNGKVVYKQLQAAAEKTGFPRAIITDSGSDLHAGIKKFLKKFCKKLRRKSRDAQHPTTVWIYDIKHKTACLLKHVLERDSSWSKFTEKAHQFKKQVSQSSLAALAPPQQRSKSRYMNLEVLLNWAQQSLLILENPQAMRKAGLNARQVRQVEAKLGWLRKFAQPLRRWNEMLAVAGAAEHYVRHEGIHTQAAEELAARLPKSTIPVVKRLRKQVLDFIEEQGRQARPGERLLGSSEVLESIIGKFKEVAGEGGRHGLTGMVLSIGALVGKQTVATVQSALTEVPTRVVRDWCRAYLGPTVQSMRQRIRQALHQEQNKKTLCLKTG